MGSLERSKEGSRPIWIHGVSVGEVKAAATLIESLHESMPDVELVISTTTSTGFEIARLLYEGDRVIYYPVDFGPFPGRALDRVNPACILLVELEIWPNFLQAAARRDVPIAVINGRISDKSYRGYKRVLTFLPQLYWVEAYFVQDAVYRDRLLGLGIAPERIALTGNMKYDSVHLAHPEHVPDELRAWLASESELIVVAGSTHGDEDLKIASLLSRLAKDHDCSIRLVVTPRHPERSPAVVSDLQSLGLKTRLWSKGMQAADPMQPEEVLVVDTIGHLETFYAACDIAFVGGSMVPHGGQNMLEPAALGKPVVFGPHTTNFRKDVELLIAAEAVIQVASWEELATALVGLLTDAGARQELGRRAVDMIRNNQGATERTRDLLAPILGRAGLLEESVV
jgi:3-deoxy-D-manno-octulosonic-acid transferase